MPWGLRLRLSFPGGVPTAGPCGSAWVTFRKPPPWWRSTIVLDDDVEIEVLSGAGHSPSHRCRLTLPHRQEVIQSGVVCVRDEGGVTAVFAS